MYRHMGPTVLALSLLGISCLRPHECTAIGCADHLAIEVAPPAGSTWKAGSYSMTLELDGEVHAAAWRWPDDRPDAGSLALAQDAALQLQIEQESTCSEERSGNAVSQSCTPIPERYRLVGWAQRTPKAVHFVLERDGVAVADQTSTPAYSTYYPNGEGCGDGCQSASVRATIDD